MPIYEYRCPDCGHEFEQMRKISDPPLTDCPSCGGAQVRKLISRTSFTLKGSGWYSDHYGLKGGSAKSDDKAGGSDAAAASTPSEASASSSSSSSSSSDSGGSSGSSTPSSSSSAD
ncbi:MAG: zinc ribbon domain-containing protein [Alphaproteobacteria bacterium]|nr:zinc ribbon domain-containing protein [Alphaproteobacteria bacterium]